MVTWAPSRAHWTAWLAPFPPDAVRNPVPATVSPGLGARSVVAIRSIIKLPTTKMCGRFSMLPLLLSFGILYHARRSFAPPKSGGRRPPLLFRYARSPAALIFTRQVLPG